MRLLHVVTPLLLSTVALACAGSTNKSHDAAGGGGGAAGSATSSGSGGLGGASGSSNAGSSSAGASGSTSVLDAAVSDSGDARDGATSNDRDASEPPIESPWGIASSTSSSRALGSWLPDIHATGIDWLRGFDEGDNFKHLQEAADNGVQVSGILHMGDTLPVNDLPGWKSYVTTLVTSCKGRVANWEMWNEPPNFTTDTTPASYGAVVAAGYDAVKAVDSSLQVGLCAQSVNVWYLENAITNGAKDHFDYVTVHPYELLGLVDQGFEAEFMSIVPTLRKMLKHVNPAKQNVPVWFTELGEPVQGNVTALHQAETLIKAYTLSLAQGVKRIHWFEGIDGDSGPFGLIAGNGDKRPSYTAMTELIKALGPKPRYVGYVLLDDKHYGFVFQHDAAFAMVAWAQPGTTDNITLSKSVTFVEPTSALSSQGTALMLTNAAVIIKGPPDELVTLARANKNKPFPWGGDFSKASSVSFSGANGASGLHPLGAQPIVTVGADKASDQSSVGAQAFAVDPNFLSYDTVPITITAVLRRKGADSAGFNLKYEGVNGPSSTGTWYTIPAGDTWTTQSWTIDDAQLVGKWGYHFSFDSDAPVNSKYLIKSVTITKP